MKEKHLLKMVVIAIFGFACYCGGIEHAKYKERAAAQELYTQKYKVLEKQADNIVKFYAANYQKEIQDLSEQYNKLIKGKIALCQAIINQDARDYNQRLLSRPVSPHTFE